MCILIARDKRVCSIKSERMQTCLLFRECIALALAWQQPSKHQARLYGVQGILSIGKTLITGRILGISGTVKGCLTGLFEGWRSLFIAGLVGAGLIGIQILPSAFDTLPASYSLARALIAGLLVGAGSALGNGCTSGHGISGNARCGTSLPLRHVAAHEVSKRTIVLKTCD